ncbi:MAG: hypothetical protein ACLFQV_09495 [Vulcanimicrobiota bacterium]
MESHLGLTPEEMISIFNRMYLDVWEKTKGNISWDLAKVSRQIKEGREVDVSQLLLEVLEVVITATRDGFVLAMYENNEKIFNELKAAAQQELLEEMEFEDKDTPEED